MPIQQVAAQLAGISSGNGAIADGDAVELKIAAVDKDLRVPIELQCIDEIYAGDSQLAGIADPRWIITDTAA